MTGKQGVGERFSGRSTRRAILTIPVARAEDFFYNAVMRFLVTLLGLSLLGSSALAQAVKDREGAVRGDAKKMEGNDRWIYNDIAAGFAEAEKSGKPLMVVLRCVPCLGCLGIDTEVLMENRELQPLMDRFVRVRVINANALDLSLFQFDYDLSFSVLFLHPDRTVYGRFGSWEHQEDSQNKATSGLRQAMERVLALHARHGELADSLAGKTGPPMRYRTPVDMPPLSGRYRPELDWDGQVVKSCVHCHQVGDAMRLELRDAGKTLPLSLIAPYPAPGTVGLHLAEDPVTKVESIDPGSPAAAAGFESGDVLRFLDGQPLVSVADIAWVLHGADDSDELIAEVSRGGERKEVRLVLPDGWRARADLSRRVGTWPMRAMAFGGMKLEDLDESGRRRLGIAGDKLALEALHVGQYNKHAAAKRAGFRKGDVIVEVGGSDARLTESELLIRNLTSHTPGEKLPAVVLRGGKRVELQMPIQ